MSTSRQGLKQRVFREFKEGLLITLYLWAVFGLLVLHKSMILSEHHLDFAYHGVALINAVALAQVMLFARKLDLSARMKDAPLKSIGVSLKTTHAPLFVRDVPQLGHAG
jgi:hypothetical protein